MPLYPKVVVDGKDYVPKEQKIGKESLALLNELNDDIRVRLGSSSSVHTKIQRLRYLLTDAGGNAR